jgi:GT2 family glycosyltransferase
VHVVIREGVYVPENRLYIVREAQARKCSHLWLLDNDMYFPDDVLLKLVAQDRDIIGAAYNMRKLPLTTTVKFADEHGTLIAKDAKDIPVVPFTCHSVGFGCTLINMQVFEKIEQPWFYCAHNAAGEMETGDDVWFCRQAAKAGYDIWADPTLGVKHIGDFAY